ncbi:MAG: carbohydrate-binding family 9-like protein [Candidatus Saccharicenans sp.]|uniref:carbohydrate-binding family 9-like protein n=1 Tax=Candidatus Saccharicenans sp. TaxID=2819258 RepID=UPI00404AB7DE
MKKIAIPVPTLTFICLVGLPLFSELYKMEAPKIKPVLRYYMCHRAAEPILIDGRLAENSWKKVYWSEDFLDIVGKSQPRPRYKTRVKMLWDDEYFYIGAELEEPHVWATLTARDSIIYQDNDFEVFIDPDGDSHNYYELEINALNTVWDLLLIKPYRDGGPAIHAWDIQGLKTAVRVDGTINNPTDKDRGWSVEIAIPWEVLKEAAPLKKKPESGDRWRVNFSRVEYRTVVENGAYVKMKDKNSGQVLPEDNWTWAPQGLINIHYPEMWGYVQFTSTEAGKAREYCEEDPEAEVRWALRLIYYRQRDYFIQNGRFAPSLEELGLTREKDLKIKGWDYPPQVQATTSLFEAIYTSKKGEKLHIRHDGLVWKTEAH